MRPGLQVEAEGVRSGWRGQISTSEKLGEAAVLSVCHSDAHFVTVKRWRSQLCGNVFLALLRLDFQINELDQPPSI